MSKRTKWLLLLLAFIVLATIVCPRRVHSQALAVAETSVEPHLCAGRSSAPKCDRSTRASPHSPIGKGVAQAKSSQRSFGRWIIPEFRQPEKSYPGILGRCEDEYAPGASKNDMPRRVELG